MNTQTEAERLAAMLLFEREQEYKTVKYTTAGKAARELRRLSAANAELLDALQGLMYWDNSKSEWGIARAIIAKHTKEQP